MCLKCWCVPVFYLQEAGRPLRNEMLKNWCFRCTGFRDSPSPTTVYRASSHKLQKLGRSCASAHRKRLRYKRICQTRTKLRAARPTSIHPPCAAQSAQLLHSRFTNRMLSGEVRFGVDGEKRDIKVGGGGVCVGAPQKTEAHQSALLWSAAFQAHPCHSCVRGLRIESRRLMHGAHLKSVTHARTCSQSTPRYPQIRSAPCQKQTLQLVRNRFHVPSHQQWCISGCISRRPLLTRYTDDEIGLKNEQYLPKYIHPLFIPRTSRTG